MYRRKALSKRYIIIGLVVVAVPVLYVIYAYISLNLWISADANRLESYPRVLVRNKQVVGEYKGHSEDIRNLEQALIRSNTADNRIVLCLSRSDIKFNLLGTKAYVKLFLQTALPADPTQTSKVKLLNILAKRNGRWVVTGTQNLSIE
jgi:hypothetical protein